MNSQFWTALVVVLIVGAAGVFVGQNTSSKGMSSMTSSGLVMTKGNPVSDTEKIANAMSAAPELISGDATVLDWPTGTSSEMATLKQGTNDWTCLPDDPNSPSNDPICVDEMALQWFGAYMAHETPKIAQAGIGYMLQGGGSASNVDPFATAPKSGESWMVELPHIMVFPTGELEKEIYGTEMHGGPWIMWDDTPYEHLMVPVM